MAAWLGLPRPDVSRIKSYRLRGAWPELPGQDTPEILTPALVRRITTGFATCPHRDVPEVHRHLHKQGDG